MKIKNLKEQQSWEEEDQIQCPICEDNYVHIDHPQYICGHDNGKAWAGRGDAVKIPCYCESNHRFNLIIGFHKGNSYLTYEEIKEENV
jgi:hypothetical protein